MHAEIKEQTDSPEFAESGLWDLADVPSIEPDFAFPKLTSQEEKNIIRNLDDFIKTIREGTINICSEISDTDKDFFDHKEELNLIDEEAAKYSRNIRKDLIEAKNELFRRDKEIGNALKTLEGVYWSSTHSRRFEVAYEQKIAAIFEQKSMRSDSKRTIDHIIKQIDDINNQHRVDNNDNEREARIWASGMVTTLVAAVLATIGVVSEKSYTSAGSALVAWTAALVILKLKPSDFTLKLPEMKLPKRPRNGKKPKPAHGHKA